MEKEKRISPLDGLRGLAIILVITFHAYSRWPEYIPWATEYKDFPLFKYGHLGVELFFLISGFVILMTLERCRNLKEFIHKRWLRLFPAMLIATIIIYTSAEFLHERPAGKPSLTDTLPGLLFIEPEIIRKISGIEIKNMEGAFWSLFIEVKFYLIFGTLYFADKKRSLHYMIAIFLLSFTYKSFTYLNIMNSHQIANKILFSLLSLQHFGWFCIGALIYKSHKEENHFYASTSVTILPLAILITNNHDTGYIIASTAIFTIFYISIFHENSSKIISSKIFMFFGFISYPLYLIHQNTMISLTIKTHHKFHWINEMATPIPGIIIIILISFIIAKYAEPALKKNLQFAKQYIK